VSERNKLAAGLLLRDLPVFDSFDIKEKPFTSFPFSIVMTQACDISSYCDIYDKLEFGENANIDRQIITQIIFCPAFDEDQFVEGKHLYDQYSYQMDKLTSGEKDKYQKDQHIRYHYLKSDKEGIPNLFIDFKQYFTVPARFIICVVRKDNDVLYKLEHLQYTYLADRFAHYLQRVALP